MFSAPYLLKCLFIRAGDKDRNVSAHYFLLYQFHEQSKLGRSSSWAINYREPEEAERVEIAEHNCPQAPPEKAINFFPCGWRTFLQSKEHYRLDHMGGVICTASIIWQTSTLVSVQIFQTLFGLWEIYCSKSIYKKHKLKDDFHGMCLEQRKAGVEPPTWKKIVFSPFPSMACQSLRSTK